MEGMSVYDIMHRAGLESLVSVCKCYPNPRGSTISVMVECQILLTFQALCGILFPLS